MNKSYYDPKNDKIHADTKLRYYHEKFHQLIAQKTNYNLFQSAAFFIMIYCIAFYPIQWKIAGMILFFGSEVLEELMAWNYAFNSIAKLKKVLPINSKHQRQFECGVKKNK